MADNKKINTPEEKQKITIRFNEEDKRMEKLYGALEKSGSSPEDVIARVLRHNYLLENEGE